MTYHEVMFQLDYEREIDGVEDSLFVDCVFNLVGFDDLFINYNIINYIIINNYLLFSLLLLYVIIVIIIIIKYYCYYYYY